nr:hypothetical protein [Paenibacillus harenae]
MKGRRDRPNAERREDDPNRRFSKEKSKRQADGRNRAVGEEHYFFAVKSVDQRTNERPSSACGSKPAAEALDSITAEPVVPVSHQMILN